MEKVALLCSKVVYGPGDVVFRAGDNANEIFLVIEGKAALQMELPVGPPQQRKNVSVDFVSDGEVCGWSGLVEPNVHTLTGICLRETAFLVINASGLAVVLEEDPVAGREVVYGLVNVVASRLREMMQLLVAERSLV
jgi:CRP-like cAMP-binding protein